VPQRVDDLVLEAAVRRGEDGLAALAGARGVACRRFWFLLFEFECAFGIGDDLRRTTVVERALRPGRLRFLAGSRRGGNGSREKINQNDHAPPWSMKPLMLRWKTVPS
jgi:hypothetical protein